MDALSPFRRAWLADFEFACPPGGRPAPLCVVARELRFGQLVRWWLGGGAALPGPPYPTGPDALFVAYYASAELGCHLALGWPLPCRVLDPYAEFRSHTNGLPVPCGHGLLGALAYYGLDALGAAEKEEMRALALRGGDYTAAERAALLDYCQSDVDALARLLPAMQPHPDLPRALLRGRFMAAAARMEYAGTPIDAAAHARLLSRRGSVKGALVREVDADYGAFVPADRPALDPGTAFGAAVLAAAHHAGCDPRALAAAADHLHRAGAEAVRPRREAVRAARGLTGLTGARVRRLLEAGRDHLDVPGFDVAARQVAGLYPDLGIGGGYDPDGVDEDYGPKL